MTHLARTGHMETKTYNNTSSTLGAHDKKGHFFGHATYGGTVEAIHANKATLQAEAEAMDTETLDAQLVAIKTAVKRLQDAEKALAGEMKGRLEAGETTQSFHLDTYERMGSHDWKAAAADLKMTHAAFRVKYGNVTKVTSLKPNA